MASEAGGTPVQMEKNYDLSSYINKGQGNVDSDVNIAKLALGLEIGAAVGYVNDTTKLKYPFGAFPFFRSGYEQNAMRLLKAKES